MSGLVLVALTVIGLCMGSFVNALVWRLRQQELLPEQASRKSTTKRTSKLTAADLSILHGRSMCSNCHHQLAAIDLIPVVSWLLLRGKCRYCHVKIADNPLVELTTATLFIGSYWWWPAGFHGFALVRFAFWLLLTVGFVALAVYDLRWYILPDKVVFPLIGLVAVQLVIGLVFFHMGFAAAAAAIWGVLIASGIFYVLFQVSRGAWIGGGDVKLGIVLGLLLGGPLKSLLLLFLASLLGTLISLPLLAIGKTKRNTLIPFGPFLLAAACIIEFFSGQFTAWLNTLLLK